MMMLYNHNCKHILKRQITEKPQPITLHSIFSSPLQAPARKTIPFHRQLNKYYGNNIFPFQSHRSPTRIELVAALAPRYRTALATCLAVKGNSPLSVLQDDAPFPSAASTGRAGRAAAQTGQRRRPGSPEERAPGPAWQPLLGYAALTSAFPLQPAFPPSLPLVFPPSAAPPSPGIARTPLARPVPNSSHPHPPPSGPAEPPLPLPTPAPSHSSHLPAPRVTRPREAARRRGPAALSGQVCGNGAPGLPPAPHRPPRSAPAAGDHYLAACLPPAGPPQPGHRLIIPQVPAAALCACAALTSEQDMAVPSAPLPPAHAHRATATASPAPRPPEGDRACARSLALDPTARSPAHAPSAASPATARAPAPPSTPPPLLRACALGPARRRPALRLTLWQRDGACAERPALPSGAVARYLARTCPRRSAARTATAGAGRSPRVSHCPAGTEPPHRHLAEANGAGGGNDTAFPRPCAGPGPRPVPPALRAARARGRGGEGLGRRAQPALLAAL